MQQDKSVAKQGTRSYHVKRFAAFSAISPLAQNDKKVVSTILEEQGRIDVLVSNAGIGAFGAVETMREETLRSVMETNFLAEWILPAQGESSS